MWPLPLPRDYRKGIDSSVADIKNTGPREGGTLTAGLFLQEFVDGVPWAHLDIAGPAFLGSDDGYLAKGGTGFGVRTLVELARTFVPPEVKPKTRTVKKAPVKKAPVKRTGSQEGAGQAVSAPSLTHRRAAGPVMVWVSEISRTARSRSTCSSTTRTGGRADQSRRERDQDPRLSLRVRVEQVAGQFDAHL